VIAVNEFALHLTRRAGSSARRVAVGQEARVRVGRSRLVGRISYVAATFGDEAFVTVWVRVPMVDVALPEVLD